MTLVYLMIYKYCSWEVLSKYKTYVSILKAFKFTAMAYAVVFSFKSLNGGHFINLLHTLTSAYLGAGITMALWKIKSWEVPDIEIKKIDFEKEKSKET